ncbi:hypothetical protein CSAL01_09466 [Colletotrichum salicis]|uniref:Uncharacterized protein n=1 Tax=Colletotrichum salicis TaxID=1209931 RepID=A0A135UZ11_9PEZI|nr:hypothetical protein CSAL01_09466 [Colletotrichum salicis]
MDLGEADPSTAPNGASAREHRGADGNETGSGGVVNNVLRELHTSKNPFTAISTMKFIQLIALLASMAIAAPVKQEARTETGAGLETRQGYVCDWSSGPLGGCP